MRQPLNIKLADLRQDQLKELILITEQVFADCGVDFYLLGAIARDAWYAKEQIDSRATRDVDFALYVSGERHLSDVIHQLTEKHGFSKMEEESYRLQTPFGYHIDLIPFGGISIDETVPPDGAIGKPVFINGFEEIYKSATVQVKTEEDGLKFSVATLPAIIMLKMISYDDRPEKRTQDPLDIAEIIENYFEIEKELIYEHHNELFEDSDFELDEISAVVIGREINSIVDQSPRLRERVTHILSLEEKAQKKMAEAMVRGDRTLAQAENWFRLILRGLNK